MKHDLLHNIKWLAINWSTWKRIADTNPMFLSYRREVAKARMALVIACAEYRFLWCCESCRYYNQEGK